MLLSEQKRTGTSAGSRHAATNNQSDVPLEIQLGEGRVLLQRLGQSAGSLVADAIT